MIIQHPAFDKIKSQLDRSIFIATAKENIEIFRILLKLIDNNVNILDTKHKSLLCTAVNCRSKQMINEILKNEKFDSVKSEFLKVFIYSFENNSNERDIENLLYEFDQKHDHLIDPQKLLLTALRMSFAVPFVAFLIEKGADPNIPDKFGIYPLQYAIHKDKLNLIRSLINSDKIDFSKRISTNIDEDDYDDVNLNDKGRKQDSRSSSTINTKSKYKTYLHLAAKSRNERILDLFLQQKYIDINVKDDEGETPLMDAVRDKLLENIKLLFDDDSLDYRHCNNDGNDALKIAGYNCETDDRNAYMTRLLGACGKGSSFNFSDQKSRNAFSFGKLKSAAFSFGDAKTNTTSDTAKTNTTSDTAKTNTTSDTAKTNTTSDTAKANTTSDTAKTNTTSDTAKTNTTSDTAKTNTTSDTAKTNTTSDTAKANTTFGTAKANTTFGTAKANTTFGTAKTNTTFGNAKTNTTFCNAKANTTFGIKNADTYSVSKNKRSSNSIIDEKIDNEKIKPIDSNASNIINIYPSNQSLEQEIENSITNERKNEYFDVNEFSFNNQPQLYQQDILAQQQWQQFMHTAYVNQFRYYMQMQQMQASAMASNNQQSMKASKKSEKRKKNKK